MNAPSTFQSHSSQERQKSLERLVFFSDGIFAIAITLIILDIHVSDIGDTSNLVPYLLDQLHNDFLIYAYSFLVIAFFWNSHRQIFRHMDEADTLLIVLNILFLMCVAFTPFPTDVINAYEHEQAAVIFYAISLALPGLMLSLLWWYALKKGLVENINAHRKFHYTITFLVPPVFFLTSIGITFIPYTPTIRSISVFHIRLFFLSGTDFARYYWLLILLALLVNDFFYRRAKQKM